MPDTGTFASLSPTLLARKGAARPAMRPQIAPLTRFESHQHNADSLEDLGWNDMGDAPEERSTDEVLALTPAPHDPAIDADIARQDRAAHEALQRNARQTDDALHKVVPVRPAMAVADAPAAPPEVRRQQHDIAAKMAVPEAIVPMPIAQEPAKIDPPAKITAASQAVLPAIKRTRSSALDAGRRAAFTLRLDAERHLKLRLATTLRGRSAQQLVTEALDTLLDDMPELVSLAAQVKRRSN